MFHGTDGTLFLDRGGLELIPEKRRDAQNKMVDRAEPITVENSNDQHEAHVRNFLDSVKSRKKPICDIEIGHRTTSAALLANIAYRSRRRIVWDGKSEEIIGDREAGRLLAKSYRKPWSLKI
jgi:predicted dehydrogenase